MGGDVRRVVERSRDRPPRDAQTDVEDRIARPDGEQLVAVGIAVVPAGELARLEADADDIVAPPVAAARNRAPDAVEYDGCHPLTAAHCYAPLLTTNHERHDVDTDKQSVEERGRERVSVERDGRQ